MGVDLFGMCSDNIKCLNRVSGDDEVMDLVCGYAENQNFFELSFNEVVDLSDKLKELGTEYAINVSNSLDKLLDDNPKAYYFIFHLG